MDCVKHVFNFLGHRLKIYFDARWKGDHGIGRVARVLDEHLKLPHLDLQGSPTSPFDSLRLFLAMLFRTEKGSCIFTPGYNAPLFIIRRYVMTVHDLNHIDRSENSSILKRLYYAIIMRRACRNADVVLTVSEFSRLRIIEWAKLSTERVVNIGNGFDGTYNMDVVPYMPGYPYMLCVSNRKAHKNEPRVLQAFAQAVLPAEVRLVFTGMSTPGLLQEAQELGMAGRLIFLGRVDEVDMPALYRGAIALIFPSLYEGFGLPVIEAMACGTPVLTSNTTSLPEVAGTAALLVDPTSVDEISDGIRRLFHESALRNDLTAKGLVQCAQFTWPETVQKVRMAIQAVQ